MTRTFRNAPPTRARRERELTADLLPLLVRRAMRADRDRAHRLALLAFL